MKEHNLPPADRRRVERLRRELVCMAGLSPHEVRVVRSPYRACPLGAHVDHQMGTVTGMALDRALLVAFAPRADARVVVGSRQFAGVAEFCIGEVDAGPRGDWADYARGAVFALRRATGIDRGAVMLVDGHEDVGGLSSSAAVGVAYLLALESVNGLRVPPDENVELDRIIENEFIGLNNGILDQSVILHGRSGHLTHVDCRTGAVRSLPAGGERSFCVVVLFSGLRRRLTDTDYNQRVEECRRAARALLQASGAAAGPRPVLGDVPLEVFQEFQHTLPAPLRRRAKHFFGEQARVRRGLDLWKQGDLQGFGRLMTESGRSSVENYECGNSYLRAAFEALAGCAGVYGARFSGAGFRGCCIGLADPERECEIAEQAMRRYLSACPDMADRARIYFCRSADGAGLLDEAG